MRAGPRSPLRSVAALVLFATATLKLASLSAQRAFLRSPDPVLEVPIWVVLTLAAMTELVVAFVLIQPRYSTALAGTVLLWFTACSVVYRIVHGFVASEPCPCLGYLPKLLFWSTQATNAVTVSLLVLLGVLGVRLVSHARRDMALDR